MTDKEKYKKLCEEEGTIPLFSKSWWMDAVCGNENWDIILVEENGRIIASLPYYIKKRNGITEICKATLTQNNGVWIRYQEDMKYEKTLTYEKKLMNLLIDKIEDLGISRYQQYFHYSIDNWLPFHWRGYSQTTRYTYVIEDTSNIEIINYNFNSNIRNYLRKAEKMVTVKEDMDIKEFYNINKKTFERQGVQIPYSLEVLKKIDLECSMRDARKIYYCTDDMGNIHSAVYFVWDEKSIYYLLSGTDPEYRSSQSLTLLIYEGIRLANKMNKKFDFEGSMKENIENFFRQFGAIQKQYHNIYKEFN